jgi:tellurite methyltransferase
MQTETETKFGRARAETVGYHEQYYSKHRLFDAGSWLEKPDPKIEELGPRMASVNACRVLDLGAGVGRNAIPLARMLNSDAEITAVELLPMAADLMSKYTHEHLVAGKVQVVCSDYEQVAFPDGKFHLVLGISVLEHCSNHDNLVALIKRLQKATAVGGIHYMNFSTSRKVKDHATGEPIETFVETPLQTEAWLRELGELYAGWDLEILDRMPSYAEVLTYNGKQVLWTSDELEIQARKLKD